jgi:protein-tyrosine phosphatase
MKVRHRGKETLEPGEKGEEEKKAGEADSRMSSDPLHLLVITANREQHSFTIATPEHKTVGGFKEDLERTAWIKHDQQLLFLLSKDVHLLWDDSTPMSELLGPATSPRVRSGPARMLLARDFLGVMAYRASLPAWYEDHYKLMLHMFAPDPVMPAEEVYPGVYLGELGAVYRRVQLKECKIRSILSLECMPPLWPDDFQYMVIHAEESENCNLLEIFEHALKFIQEGTKKGKVLVHCMLGVSRAATLVVAYVMRQLQVSEEEAIAVIGRRRRVFPNHAFIDQLKWFHDHRHVVDKQTADYRAIKARYTFQPEIKEYPP